MGGCCAVGAGSAVPHTIPLNGQGVTAGGDAYRILNSSDPTHPSNQSGAERVSEAEQLKIAQRKRLFKDSLQTIRSEEHLFNALARQTLWPLPVIRRVHSAYIELTRNSPNRSIELETFSEALGLTPRALFAQRIFHVCCSAHVRSNQNQNTPSPSPHAGAGGAVGGGGSSNATTPLPSPRVGGMRLATEKKRREPSDHITPTTKPLQPVAVTPPHTPAPTRAAALPNAVGGSTPPQLVITPAPESTTNTEIKTTTAADTKPPTATATASRPVATAISTASASFSASAYCSFPSFTLACYALSSTASVELRARTTFALFDLNSDGWIDFAELTLLLRSALIESTTSSADDPSFASIDSEQFEWMCRETIRAAVARYGTVSDSPAAGAGAGAAGSLTSSVGSIRTGSVIAPKPSSLTVASAHATAAAAKRAKPTSGAGAGAGGGGSVGVGGDGRSHSPLLPTIEEPTPQPVAIASSLSDTRPAPSRAGTLDSVAGDDAEVISPALAAATLAVLGHGSPRRRTDTTRISRDIGAAPTSVLTAPPPPPLIGAANESPAAGLRVIVPSSVSVVDGSSKPPLPSISVNPPHVSGGGSFSPSERMDLNTFISLVRDSPSVLESLSDPIDRWLGIGPFALSQSPPSHMPISVSYTSEQHLVVAHARGLKAARAQFESPGAKFRAESEYLYRDSGAAALLDPDTQRLDSFTLAVAAGADHNILHRKPPHQTAPKPQRQASESVSSANRSQLRRKGSFSVGRDAAAAGAIYSEADVIGQSFSEQNP